MSRPEPFRCLSTREPWAWLICAGFKDVENKSKATRHRGQVAIHAGANLADFNDVVKKRGKGRVDKSLFVFGAVVGVADLTDATDFNPSLERNAWAVGPVCWVFDNAQLLPEPIPLKGQLGLFHLPDAVAKRVREQLEHPGPAPLGPTATATAKALEPSAFDICLWRAGTYCDLERPADAVRQCDKALGMEPAASEAWLVRGWAHICGREFAKALEDSNGAVRLIPDDPRCYFVRWKACRGLGDEKKAEAAYQKAVELDPDYADMKNEGEEDEDE